MGVYLQGILYVGEIEKTYNSDGLVNYSKFKEVNSIMDRVLNVRSYPYNFRLKEDIEKRLRVLPSSDELETQIETTYH